MSVNISGNLAYKYQEKRDAARINDRIINKTIPTAEKLFYLFSVIFIVVLASVVISGYAQIAEYNYEAQMLEKSIVSVNENIDDLESQIAELSSPERITKIAQEKLGMTLDESRVIVINKN